jgi:hypothetical protein
MKFDFVTDEKFRLILSRDFEELNKCLDIKASKSVLILSGSIIESVLTYYFTNFTPDGVDSEKVLSMDLAHLLGLAKEHNLISQSTKELSTVIKNYRNLIHPGREIRKNEKFDFDSAVVAKSLLNIVLKEIKENYLNNLGHTASDVIQKLENDSISQPIFEIIVAKLHKTEKTKLYDLLVEYNLQDSECRTQLTNPKKYINILKSQVNRLVVVNQLLRLIHKIETGVKWEVMLYFYLLFDDINYLEDSDIEIILLYVINALSEATKNKNETDNYVNQQLFSVFGTHLNSDEVKKEFLKLACSIVSNFHIEPHLYFMAYDQLINSIDISKKDKVKEYILKNTHSYLSNDFYEKYNDGDYVPF